MKNRWLVLVLVLGLLLSACTGPTVTQTSTQVPSEVPTEAVTHATAEAASTPTETAQTLTITDALGRTVTLPQPPQKIVVTGKASLMVLDAMYMFPEAQQRVVAFEDLSQGTVNFISLLDPQYAEKAWLKRDAGVEQFVTAEPDLVVMKSSNAEKYGAPIEAVNIPVIYLDFETPEQYTRDLGILGQIFVNPQRAQELVAYYQGKVDAITAALPADASRPSTLVLQYALKDGAVAFTVPPLSWIQTLMVEMAGGTVAWQDVQASSGWTTVTIEQIAAWDPDVILIVAYNDDPSAVTAALKEDAQWKTLRAVQNGKLLGFPKDLYSWDQPDTRWTLGLQWLATVLHPEQFKPEELMPAVQEFYQFAYGMDAQTFAAKIQPTLQGDLP
jgi:iron complex transport system substrate-binding protein